MHTLRSYLAGRWQTGTGAPTPLFDPTTEEVIAGANTEGLDFAEALEHCRTVGGPALRAMSFAERGALLKAMAKALYGHREELLALSTRSGGNTRGDAKFDVDGATGTMAFYGKLGEGLGDGKWLADGESEQLAPNPRFIGRHVKVPRRGVAVHINAFNFPAWGFGEKAAVALLAGMPVLCKPATSTAVLTERMFEILVESGVVPAGVLALVAGGAGDLTDHLGPQDVLSFTGGSATAAYLRSRPNLAAAGVRMNVEADSLNAAILGPDVDRDSTAYDLFLKEVRKDMTQKAGQKCTAIRRLFVHRDHLDAVRDDLAEGVRSIVVGDPSEKDVDTGPVATARQRDDAMAGIARLSEHGRFVVGDGGRGPLRGVGDKGYFVGACLLEMPSASDAGAAHDVEVFGPVQTLLPWSSDEELIAAVSRGHGGLVTSVYSDDRDWSADLALELAPHHGRVHLGSSKVADHSPGPGTVLPQMVHGGPGRAGGGEELGGLRGLDFYLQRCAIQGLKRVVEKLA